MGKLPNEPATEPSLAQSVHPLRDMLMIAAPSVATMTSYTIMQFFDRMMIKDIGEDPIYLAAHGNASISTWTMLTFAVGTIGILNSFVSQNLGAGKPMRGAAYAWNGIWLSMVYWVALVLPAAIYAPTLLGGLGHSPELYELELQYFQIGLFGSIFTLVSKSVHNYFFGMHRPGIVLVAVVAGNLVNIVLNAVLIFGRDGPPAYWPFHDAIRSLADALNIPAMGIAGAAWALVIGTVVEFLIPFCLFLGPRYAGQFGTRRAWCFDTRIVRDILRVGWPAGLMFLSELLCWAYLMVFLVGAASERAAEVAGKTAAEIEHAGTVATSAGFAALQWMHLSFMPAIGLSIATQVLVGKAIGASDPDTAASRTKLGLTLATVYMGSWGLLYLFFQHDLISVFVNPETADADVEVILSLGAKMLIAAAVFQVFDAISITLSAALRGAGDTVVPGVAQMVSSWVCIVGGGHLLIAFWPALGAIGPWIGAGAYFICFAAFLGWRFRAGKWRSIRLTHPDLLHNLPPDEVVPGQGL